MNLDDNVSNHMKLVELPAREPDPHIIELLEQLLEDVKAGKFETREDR